MKCISIFAFSIILQTLHAVDWPEFRGAGGQGHAVGQKPPVPVDNNLTGVKWKIPGTGWSSPVIVNGRVYLTTTIKDNNGVLLNAVCLETAQGKLAWHREVFKVPGVPRMHRKNSQASPTPIIRDGRIYVHFGHMGTACLDLDGKVIWKNQTLKYAPVHGNGGSPALVNNKLIFSCDGARDPFVVALNANNGKELWRVKRSVTAKKKFSFCTPLVIGNGLDTQVLLPGSDMIGAYHPDTGREIWRVTYKGYSVVPRPVAGHGMVFFSTGFDRATAMAVKLGGKGDVTRSHVAWTLAKGAPHTPSMLLIGHEIYMVSDGGIASCVEAKTGKVIWSERLGGSHSASPIYADGRLYFVSEAGVLNVLAAGREFKVLGKHDLGERTLASPAVVNHSLYIRTENHLWRFSQRKFSKR